MRLSQTLFACADDHPTQKLIHLLIGASIFLVVIYLADNFVGNPFWSLSVLFDLDKESNIPTWFSSMIWVMAAYAGYRAHVMSLNIDPLAARFWQVASVVFLLFSCDEVARIHETAGALLNKKVFHLHLEWSAWPVLFGPFIVLGAAFFLSYSWKALRNFPETRSKIFIGTLIVLFGAIVMESSVFFFHRTSHHWLYIFEVAIEELFEMLGAIIILSGILQYLNRANKANETGKLL